MLPPITLPRILLLSLTLTTTLTPFTNAIPTADLHASPNNKIPINNRTAQEIITLLNLTPNIERGYFVETFRDSINVTTSNPNITTPENGSRSASTAIYYLLEGTEGNSRWHRVDAVEVWHYYAGAPLVLSLARDDGSPVREVTLGPDVFDGGQRPQVVVGSWEWQRARSLGDWTLVGTTGEFCSFSIPFTRCL
jgi:uncharacterized protein